MTTIYDNSLHNTSITNTITISSNSTPQSSSSSNITNMSKNGSGASGDGDDWYEKMIIDTRNCEKLCPKYSVCTIFKFDYHLLKKYIQLFRVFEQCPCRHCLTVSRCAGRGMVCFERILVFMDYIRIKDNIEKNSLVCTQKSVNTDGRNNE